MNKALKKLKENNVLIMSGELDGKTTLAKIYVLFFLQKYMIFVI